MLGTMLLHSMQIIFYRIHESEMKDFYKKTYMKNILFYNVISLNNFF